MSGANTYGGGTNIGSGVLQLGVANSLPSSGTVGVSGGTLNLNGNNRMLGAVSISSGSIGGGGTLTGTGYTVSSGTISSILAGVSAALRFGRRHNGLERGQHLRRRHEHRQRRSTTWRRHSLPSSGTVGVSGGTLILNGNNQSVGAVSISSGSIGGGGILTGTGFTVTGGTIGAKPCSGAA